MTETKPKRTTRRGRIFPEIQWTPEQQAQWREEREVFYQRCKPIFARVKSELIETHYNWFVAVEPDSEGESNNLSALNKPHHEFQLILKDLLVFFHVQES